MKELPSFFTSALLQEAPPEPGTLQVTFLGTGTSQGVPVIGCNCEVCTSPDPRDNRLRCSVLVRYQDFNFVIDTGPDFRQQMLRAQVHDLHAVLLTHAHNDHIIGLDDVRPYNFKYWRNMPLYASELVLEQVKLRFHYIFEKDPYPGSPMIELHAINRDHSFQLGGLNILPIEVMHGNIPVLGFRMGQFVYLTDVKTIHETEMEKAMNAKVLVLNALHHTEHHSHLNLSQALRLIEKLAPEKAYLTHISHNMGLHAQVSEQLPASVELGYDGLEIVL